MGFVDIVGDGTGTGTAPAGRTRPRRRRSSSSTAAPFFFFFFPAAASLPVIMLILVIASAPGCRCWSKEGHIMTCRIAQGLLEPAAADAVRNLLPEYAEGELSALCVWPDQVRHWHRYRWTSPLHFIDTPDDACDFDYARDCHDPHGAADMCVAGAIHNFTSQLMHYNHGTADRRYNLTEALLFLSHFMGDIHQPMHVGFTSDEGGNTIQLHWFKHKSNLHHVSLLASYYSSSSPHKALHSKLTR